MLRNWNYGPSCAVCCWALVPVSQISCNFEAAHSTFSYVNDRFQSRAREENVKHAPIELVHGDFLKSSAVKVAISSAGLVFMNNPRFGPELNLKVLSQSFLTPTLTFVSRFALTAFIRWTLPAHAKRLQIGAFPPAMNLLTLLFWWSLNQICFDSLIGTRGHNRHPGSDLLTYQKLVKVFFLPYQQNSKVTVSHHLQVGDGAVSWKHYGVDLHVLERV